MRYKHILYPEAIFNLEPSGLLERIKKAHKKCEFSFTGHLMMDDVPKYIAELSKGGYIKTLMKKGDVSLIKRMNKAFQEPEKYKWKIERLENGITEEEIEPEDFLAMSGWRASCILKPNELWNYRKFGFKNLSDFLGTFAAVMENELRDDSYRAGMRWKTEFPTGKTVLNEITGDTNGDFRLHQTDITPYKTINPLGNEVSYRPVFGNDEAGISAYYSVEGTFLVSILKWIEQTKIINHDALKIKANEIISKIKPLGQSGGTCAEHFGGFDRNPLEFFIGFDIDIPKLEPGFKTNKYTPFYLDMQFKGCYGAYLHPNEKDLIYSIVPEDNKNEKREPSAHFLPSDAIPLIEGTLYQCARGLGRTSARQAIDILEYYFSPKMKEDLERFKKL
jgi:hypothetical protein